MTQLELLPSTTAPIVHGPFISRKQAKAQGLTYYFVGRLCCNGHVSIRNVSDYGCKECRDQRKIQRRELGVDAQKAREYSAQWRAAHPGHWKKHEQKRKADADAVARRNERARQRRASNPLVAEKERLRKIAKAPIRRKQSMDRYYSDHQFRLLKTLRSRLYAIVRRGMGKKKGSTLELLGCSLPELRQHLEAQFADGMSWDNYGRNGWHVDHVRPCASFDLNDPDQQRQCFHYTNLQPLWAADNIRKGAKWDGSTH